MSCSIRHNPNNAAKENNQPITKKEGYQATG
jgi:hypothetical protein